MTEKELQDAVIEALHRYGWYVAHFSPAPMSTKGGVVWRTPFKADGKGFPDIVAVRKSVIFIELKVGANKLSPEQEEWRQRLRGAEAEYYCLNDEDWRYGLIERLLR